MTVKRAYIKQAVIHLKKRFGFYYNKIPLHQTWLLPSKGATVFEVDWAAPHFVPCEPTNPPRNITAKALESAWGRDNAWGNQLFQFYLNAFRRKFEFDAHFSRRQSHVHAVLVSHA